MFRKGKNLRGAVRSDFKKLDSFTLETSKNPLIHSFLRNGRPRVKRATLRVNFLFLSPEEMYYISNTSKIEKHLKYNKSTLKLTQYWLKICQEQKFTLETFSAARRDGIKKFNDIQMWSKLYFPKKRGLE